MEVFTSKVKTIWITDDDDDDLIIFRDVIQNISPAIELKEFRNGEELLNALAILSAPDLLFLDINMPLKDGQQCLEEIKKQRQFAELPIIVYSSSPKPLDIFNSYESGASLYIRKPSSFDEIVLILRKALQLDWKQCKEITSSHFVDGKYVPFMAL